MIELKISFSSLIDLKNFLKSDKVSIKNINEIARSEIRKNKQWTQFEDDYLIDNYYKFKIRVIAKSLNRSTSSVAARVQSMKNKKILKNKYPRNGNVVENKYENLR